MVGVVLFVLFRRLSAVVLSLLVVFVSLLATFGAMVLLDIPTSIAGQVLAPLLICVGVCDAVHILTLVYDRLDRGASREEALVHALGHSGLPVLMTSLTTAGGLLSFVSGELAQIVNLGIAAPIGIAIAYLLTMLLLPSLLAIVPLRARGRRGPPRLERWLAERLVRLGDFAAAHATAVVVGALALAAAAALGAAQLRFSQDLLRWLPESEPLRIATELVDDSLRGSTALEILVDTRRPAGIQDPALLRGLEAATRAAEAYQKPPLATGKVLSIVDVVKETHRALNENRADHYRIPDARELVAQELLLFESSGSEDLAELVDLPYQVARVTVRTTSADYMHFPDFVEDMRAIFRQALGDSVDLTLTGSAALYARTFSVVNTSMARSYALALVVITPLMVLLIGSFKVGLLAMIPNLLPVLLTLGLMGWLDIRVDNSTLMVGCILVGLAVDDTIHFMHRYRRAFEASGDVRESVRETLASTGVALVMTSLVIGIGFFVMTFAYMNNTRDFGRLACFATAAALLADLVLTPALLASVSRRAGR
jgi:predicted RND superfamily exporter protein